MNEQVDEREDKEPISIDKLRRESRMRQEHDDYVPDPFMPAGFYPNTFREEW